MRGLALVAARGSVGPTMLAVGLTRRGGRPENRRRWRVLRAHAGVVWTVESVMGRTEVGDGVKAARDSPPSGLIAMLFTDIEGSTSLAASLGEAWSAVLGAYHELVGTSVSRAGGWVDGTAGDGFFVTFGDVSAAGRAAVEIQRALRTRAWPAGVGELRCGWVCMWGRSSAPHTDMWAWRSIGPRVWRRPLVEVSC